MRLKVWTVVTSEESMGVTSAWVPSYEQRVLAIWVRRSWRPLFPLTRKRLKS